jgi:hypothetical protein
MSAAGWVTMAVVLGIAWGGFGFTLWLATRREAAKRRRDTARRG